MVYIIIGVILILVVFLMIRASKQEPLEENRYHIYSYVVMEEKMKGNSMKQIIHCGIWQSVILSSIQDRSCVG
jgi:isochorismate hydrolase